MLEDIARSLSDGRKLVLVHGNADADAMGCAYAIWRTFDDVHVHVPNSMDRMSKHIYSHLDIETVDEVDPEDYDTFVVVDTSSPDQIAVDFELPPSIVIDHHTRTDRWDGHVYYCDDTKRSCAEIILQLVSLVGPVPKDVAMALMAGMLTDSGHFTYATSDLLRSFSSLMDEAGVEMDEVMSLTDLDVSMSERMSQLRGAQRIRFERIGAHIVAISFGSTYESSVCKSMLALGADVAFVGSQRDDEFRLSSRARQDIVRKGVHLGRMMETVSSDTGNDGGGHPGAAGMSGHGDVEAILNILMSITLDLFRKIRDEESSSE